MQRLHARDMDELLAREDIDATLICTGDRWHALASMRAAKAGKKKPSAKKAPAKKKAAPKKKAAAKKPAAKKPATKKAPAAKE